jgi:TM2 domain-containing membrane protein YozV/predicted negative regulator of RcsB-dependent stress response
MQDSDSNAASELQQPTPAVEDPTRAEYDRLKQKRAEASDPDIISVLDMRLAELDSQIQSSESPTDGVEPEESEEIQKLRQELQRLEEKRASSKDKNVHAVLDMRIMQIRPLLPAPKKSKEPRKKLAEIDEEESGPPPPSPTDEEAKQAENLIRQSMLEKRRGNVNGATDLLKKAAAIAPGSPVVLEALGDDLVFRNLSKQARKVYSTALKLDPKNVGLERKYAETVLKTTTTMSVEDQLRFGMSDSLFITGEDAVAGLTAARMFSAIIPGVGQMVLGRNVKGGILLGIWALLIAIVCLWNKDFKTLMIYIEGKGPAPQIKILIPLIAMAGVWITAMADLSGSNSKAAARHKIIDRPKPPVDLPFE